MIYKLKNLYYCPILQEYDAKHTLKGFSGCPFKKIEMRVVGKTDIYTTEAEVKAATGDIIHITSKGMYCQWTNGETQPDGKCLDYEVRFCCSEFECEGPKTDWLDRDDPSGTMDNEA